METGRDLLQGWPLLLSLRWRARWHGGKQDASHPPLPSPGVPRAAALLAMVRGREGWGGEILPMPPTHPNAGDCAACKTVFLKKLALMPKCCSLLL